MRDEEMGSRPLRAASGRRVLIPRAEFERVLRGQAGFGMQTVREPLRATSQKTSKRPCEQSPLPSIAAVYAEATGHSLAVIGKQRRPFSASDVPMLEELLDKMPEVRLLVIDSIAQLLGDLNTSKDNEVRTALQSLKELAERHNTAVVCVVHLRKTEAERAIYRGLVVAPEKH